MMHTFEDELALALDDELGFFELWTPTEIRTYVEEVRSKIVALDYDIAASADCFAGTDLRQWEAFKVRYADFVTEYTDASWITRWSVSIVRTAERFAQELRDFMSLYKSRCGKSPTFERVDIPREGQPELTDTLKTVTTLAAVVVGGWILFKLIDR